MITETGAAATPLVQSMFDSSIGVRAAAHQPLASATLNGFGDFSRAEIAALGALVEYVSITQKRPATTVASASL